MDPIAVTDLRDIVLDLLGPELRPENQAEFEAEWERLQRKAIQLGLEVLDCEEAGLSYAAGARRPGDWPTLARAHYGLMDLLHFEIPSPHLAHVRAALERARLLDAEGFGQDLLVAAAHDHTPASALVRFAIYELIRLNLWLLTWDRPRIEALGAMADIDVEAQRILKRRLGDPMIYDPAVRPLMVLVAEALVELVNVAREKEELLMASGAALRRFYEGLTEAAGLARELNAADAHIVRNDYAQHVGDERLESVMLSERHPRVLRSQQSVDTRRCRLSAKVREGAVVRRGICAADIMREVYLRIEVRK